MRFASGRTPLLVSIPHDGTIVPDDIAARFTPEARQVPDTDWHVGRLYDFATKLGAHVLQATHSRYVVDLNRDPNDTPLYPGMDNTEVCPLLTFDRRPIYKPGMAPTRHEVEVRLAAYWRPYHAKITATLAEIRARHGFAVLFDAHSIRSRLPRFFDGILPDFHFGTVNDTSADAALAARGFAVLERARGYSAVHNGRFTGGFITRTYGNPASGVHAIQLELVQSSYMNESYPFGYLPDRAERVKAVPKRLIAELLAWAEGRSAQPQSVGSTK